MGECACCGEDLDQNGNCINDCNPSDILIAEGQRPDEFDILKESLKGGVCTL